MISRALHMAQCDGRSSATEDGRCQSSVGFQAPDIGMRYNDLVAFVVWKNNGWGALDGRLFCPSCAGKFLTAKTPSRQGEESGVARE